MAKKMKKVWKCRYCEGVNSKKELYCVSCGARWLGKVNVSKESCLEEVQVYPEEVQSCMEEKRIENKEEEYEPKSISYSYGCADELVAYNLKKVVLGLTILFVMIMCMLSIIKEIVTINMEVSHTYDDETYEDVAEWEM